MNQIFPLFCALSISFILLASCHRRELTYEDNFTVPIVINADWSDMSSAPTGMSVYCYPESGEAPTIVITNNISSATVNLLEGTYKILVFNQIPSDFGTISFSGMDSYETAEINTVADASKTAKASSEIAREPEELATATYIDLEISDEVVQRTMDLRSSGTVTRSEDLVYQSIYVTPKVVIKTTRVTVRITGIYNFYSSSATLYGMADGYNFSEQKSHTSMTTHSLESWSSTTYAEDYREGEITTTFVCFGLPGQTTTTRSDDYSDWDGMLDIDITLVDKQTIVSESIPLNDKVTTTGDDSSKSEDTDITTNVNVDININSGFTFDDDPTSDDKPIVLPDVESAVGGESSFDATIDDWGEEERYNLSV
ncbi:MAG: DUF5119 domain-containing protein [Bacteroidales bacterium]